MTKTALALLFALSCVPARSAGYDYTPPQQTKRGGAAVAAGEGGMSDADIKAGLAKAEKGIEELRSLAADAVHALGQKQGANGPAESIEDAFRKKFLAECKSTFNADSYLASKTFATASDDLQGYLTCRAAVTKSVAPCEALPATLAPTEGKSARGPAESAPRDLCRDESRQLMLLTAVMSGAQACGEAAEVFSDAPAAKRADVCRAVLAGDCARAAAAAGAGPEWTRSCTAIASLRGASSAQACEGAAVPKQLQKVCREAVKMRKNPTCARDDAKLAASHCAAATENRIKLMKPDIDAQAAGAKPVAAGTRAMEEYKKKRAEIDGILGRIDLVSRSAPAGGEGYKTNSPRLKKARQAVAEIDKDLKTAIGSK